MKKITLMIVSILLLMGGCAAGGPVSAPATPVPVSQSSPSPSATPNPTPVPISIPTTQPDETVNPVSESQPTDTASSTEKPESTAMVSPTAKPQPTATVSDKPAPTKTAKPVDWEIKPTATPTAAPTPTPDQGIAADLTEIDIDASDSCRDFIAERPLSDTYGETTFYRLTDKGYVKLGVIPGYMTGSVGYQKPTLTVDGSGVVYSIERSVLASWARIAKTYVVKNGRLTLKAPADSLYAIRNAPVFFVRETITIFDPDKNSNVTLVPGDQVSFEDTNEKSWLMGFYYTAETHGRVLLYMDDMDSIKDGPFFGDCFYSDQVEWVG